MSFFIRNKQAGNRKRSAKAAKHQTHGDRAKGGRGGKKFTTKRTAAPFEDEVLSSSDDENENVAPASDIEYSSEDDTETAAEKRLRLTKDYLKLIREQEEEKAQDVDAVIAERLQNEVLDRSGLLHRQVAANYTSPKTSDIRTYRGGHQKSLTCIAVCSDNQHCFTASKDGAICKWNISSGKKIYKISGASKREQKTHIGHTAQVLCMAVSSDDKYLATGDSNKVIHVWDGESDTSRLLGSFKKQNAHRDAVTGLAFRKGTHQLFSCSQDRTVRHWNIDDMAFVEVLFGHEDGVTGIDCLSRERALTSGGRDCTMRVWKIVEESQLMFNGHRGSIDCCALINENTFISGGDDNTLCLWAANKKKPVATVYPAHPGPPSHQTTTNGGTALSGTDTISDHIHSAAAADTMQTKDNWITAVTSLQYTDLAASGSKDGTIRVWRCGKDFKSLDLQFSIPMSGFINGLCFTPDGKHLLAAVGQEHKLGRWWRIPKAKNSLAVIKLTCTAS